MESRRTAVSLQNAGGAAAGQGSSSSAAVQQAQQQPQNNIIGPAYQQNSQQHGTTNNLSNIAKINARLRARNPAVVNSMQATSPQLLLPLSQRSLSPPSQQVIHPVMHTPTSGGMQGHHSHGSQNSHGHGHNTHHGHGHGHGNNHGHSGPHQFQLTNNQGNSSQGGRPNSYTLNLNIASINNKLLSNNNGQSSMPPSRDPHNQRKILHKSLNSVTTNQTVNNRSPDNSEFHGQKPLSSHGINMSVQMLQQRRQQSLEMTNKQVPLSEMHDLDLSGGVTGDNNAGPSSVSLKQKISSNNRPRRNPREKSYDLYSQKIQLPPMHSKSNVETSQPGSASNGQGMPQFNSKRQSATKNDRTYSLPSGGTMHSNQTGLQIGVNNKTNGMTTMPPASPNANRFNGQYRNAPMSNSNVDGSGPPNSQAISGFFSARAQQNQNLTSGGNVDKQSIDLAASGPNNQNPMSGPGIASPRRQLQQQQQSAHNQMGQASPMNTIRSQRQKSTGASSSQQQANGKPLSPISDTVNSPRNDNLPQGDLPSPQSRTQYSSQQSQGDQNSQATTKAQTSNNDSEKPSSDEDVDKEPVDPNIQFVEVQQLLFGENPPVLDPKKLFLKNHEPTKASTKKCGVIKSYAANTNQGIIREYNEDRVSIILNILKPKSKAKLDIEWPQICFFGVFDGHGGSACADYLRDNLHNYVVQHDLFPQNPIEAIKQGFKDCERNFINLVEMAQQRAQNQMPGQQVGPERSGSCANVVVIIEDMAYVANVGDSRCIMSMNAGAETAVLTRDHKPDDDQERLRIQAGGGKIYRTQTFAKAAANPGEKDLYVQGPLRVFPGRLSVSRTFGDIEAKKIKYSGNPNVVVCEPEITSFKLKDNFDFFLIGCDGIFERLTNKETFNAIWDRIADQTTKRVPDMLTPPYSNNRQKQPQVSLKSPRMPRQAQDFFYDEHIAAAEGVEIGLRVSAASRSLDNITILILGLKNLKTTVKKLNEGQTLTQIRKQIRAEQAKIPNTYKQDFFGVEQNDDSLGKNQEAEQLQDYSEGGIPSPKTGASPGPKTNHI